MHAKNLMHRDLKPENILCEDFADQDDDDLTVKVADFGLAVRFDRGEKRTDGCGTLDYFAPEICKGVPYD